MQAQVPAAAKLPNQYRHRRTLQRVRWCLEREAVDRETAVLCIEGTLREIIAPMADLLTEYASAAVDESATAGESMDGTYLRACCIDRFSKWLRPRYSEPFIESLFQTQLGLDYLYSELSRLCAGASERI